MEHRVHGVHHVTAIAGDPQQNLGFYVGVLGMRLVKRSVNQDDPGTYHLFYADGVGTPGTDLTFFPWTRLAPGRPGTGLVVEVPLAVPAGSLPYWEDRLAANGVEVDASDTRFGERTLTFRDPHGLALALVESDGDRESVPWAESPVPEPSQVRGLHAPRLSVRRLGPTRALLEDVMGFERVGTEGAWHRFAANGGGSGRIVEVQELPDESPGAWGTGAVHHVAWRVRDDEEQMALRERIQEIGLRPTPQIDRFWFRSVYFREPGGVLFELATDGPGFDRDEPAERLGEKLILPPWLESRRAEIEAVLPALAQPTPG